MAATYSRKNPLEIIRKLGNKQPASDARHTCLSCKHEYPVEVIKDNGHISGVERCPRCEAFRPMNQSERDLAEQWRFLSMRYARRHDANRRNELSASRYHATSYADMEQIAFIGICRAAMMFREANGYSFGTLATWWMKRQFGDAIKNEQTSHRAIQSAFSTVDKVEVKEVEQGLATTSQVDAKEDVEYLIEHSGLTSSQKRFIRSYLAGDPRGDDGRPYTKEGTKSRKTKIVHIMRNAVKMGSCKI